MMDSEKQTFYIKVAPRAGAWVEIREMSMLSTLTAKSLPVRERGLKLPVGCSRRGRASRSPCGSVG